MNLCSFLSRAPRPTSIMWSSASTTDRTNVWSYAGVKSFGGDRDDLSLHPTVKPVAMVADTMRDCSHRKAIVLDAFAGSGTTLEIAAEKTGRRGYERDHPAYCDVVRRCTLYAA